MFIPPLWNRLLWHSYTKHIYSWWKPRLWSTLRSIGKWPRLQSSCCSTAFSFSWYCAFIWAILAFFMGWKNGQWVFHPPVRVVCDWCGFGWRHQGSAVTLGFGAELEGYAVWWMEGRMDICSSLSLRCLGVTEAVNRAVNLLTYWAQY